MTTHQLNYKSVILDITGTYTEGTYEGDEPEEFEIEQIHLSDIDVTELLEDNINELQIDILNKFYR